MARFAQTDSRDSNADSGTAASPLPATFQKHHLSQSESAPGNWLEDSSGCETEEQDHLARSVRRPDPQVTESSGQHRGGGGVRARPPWTLMLPLR